MMLFISLVFLMPRGRFRTEEKLLGFIHLLLNEIKTQISNEEEENQPTPNTTTCQPPSALPFAVLLHFLCFQGVLESQLTIILAQDTNFKFALHWYYF